MLDETDDHRLALDAAGGDRAAFERLVQRHYERIHGLAWRFMGGPPDSEDLAHDVCVTLGQRIRSYRGDARFTTWLYQVVLNAARDRMRRRATRAKATQSFAEIDGLRRDKGPTMLIAQQLTIDHQIQRPVAVQVDELDALDLLVRHGHGPVAHKNRPAPPVALAGI